MSSFLRELQSIYGEGYGGDTSNYPPQTYAVQQNNTSYRKGELPGATPGQGIRTYTVSSDPYGLENEEESVKDKDVLVSKKQIIDKITNLINGGEDNITSLPHLFELLKYIKSL